MATDARHVVAVACLLLSLTPVATAQAVPATGSTCELKKDLDHDRNPATPPIRAGSRFTEHSWADGWYLGDFWGGPQNVRVHHSYLGPPCGD